MIHLTPTKTLNEEQSFLGWFTINGELGLIRRGHGVLVHFNEELLLSWSLEDYSTNKLFFCSLMDGNTPKLQRKLSTAQHILTICTNDTPHYVWTECNSIQTYNPMSGVKIVRTPCKAYDTLIPSSNASQCRFP